MISAKLVKRVLVASSCMLLIACGAPPTPADTETAEVPSTTEQTALVSIGDVNIRIQHDPEAMQPMATITYLEPIPAPADLLLFMSDIVPAIRDATDCFAIVPSFHGVEWVDINDPISAEFGPVDIVITCPATN